MKPIGILFESYRHFIQRLDIQNNIEEFKVSFKEWTLRGSEQRYIAIIPEYAGEDLDWHRYYGIEFKNILGPNYIVCTVPDELKCRIHP